MADVKQKPFAEVTKEFQQGENDTGSPQVQVAYLTHRILTLTAGHFKQHKKDKHSKRGLLRCVEEYLGIDPTLE